MFTASATFGEEEEEERSQRTIKEEKLAFF